MHHGRSVGDAERDNMGELEVEGNEDIPRKRVCRCRAIVMACDCAAHAIMETAEVFEGVRACRRGVARDDGGLASVFHYLSVRD